MEEENFNVKNSVQSKHTTTMPKSITADEAILSYTKDSVIKFGRTLIRGLNQRIVYTTALINYYNTIITQMKVGRHGRLSNKKQQKYEAQIVAQKTLLQHYKDIREALYQATYEINPDKSKLYCEMFNEIILNGKKASDIAQEKNVSLFTILEIQASIENDFVDDEFDKE